MWSTVLPVVGALLAPIGAYLLAARRMSGRIDTTEASQLWDEAGKIRKDCAEQLDRANERITGLVRENESLRDKIRALEDRIEAVAGTVAHHEEELNGGG